MRHAAVATAPTISILNYCLINKGGIQIIPANTGENLNIEHFWVPLLLDITLIYAQQRRLGPKRRHFLERCVVLGQNDAHTRLVVQSFCKYETNIYESGRQRRDVIIHIEHALATIIPSRVPPPPVSATRLWLKNNLFKSSFDILSFPYQWHNHSKYDIYK